MEGGGSRVEEEVEGGGWSVDGAGGAWVEGGGWRVEEEVEGRKWSVDGGGGGRKIEVEDRDGG